MPNLVSNSKHLCMTRKSIVEDIRKTMHSHNPHCSTILYGSEARGESRIDSDIDLLILVDGDKLTVADELKITAPLYDIEVRTGVIISPYVVLRKSWENRPFKTPFFNNIEKEGILL